MVDPLTEEQLRAALASLPGWSHANGALRKRFELGDLPAAVAFITRVAFEAERLDHHPEIRNLSGAVELTLTTHDAGDRVSLRDIALAERVEAIAGTSPRSKP
jgi:4a-hydroxytetrahydrobiopterin dehydratase